MYEQQRDTFAVAKSAECELHDLLDGNKIRWKTRSFRLARPSGVDDNF